MRLSGWTARNLSDKMGSHAAFHIRFHIRHTLYYEPERFAEAVARRELAAYRVVFVYNAERNKRPTELFGIIVGMSLGGPDVPREERDTIGRVMQAWADLAAATGQFDYPTLQQQRVNSTTILKHERLRLHVGPL